LTDFKLSENYPSAERHVHVTHVQDHQVKQTGNRNMADFLPARRKQHLKRRLIAKLLLAIL